jgi:hypothetical protein
LWNKKNSRQENSEYEKGIREIPLYKAITLAKYYNVSLDYITELSDEKRAIK